MYYSRQPIGTDQIPSTSYDICQFNYTDNNIDEHNVEPLTKQQRTKWTLKVTEINETTQAYTESILPYSAKFWWGKTLANRSFQSFGKENVGKFTAIYISHFSESGIWLGKILVNDVPFAKFAKVFPRQNFALYGI